MAAVSPASLETGKGRDATEACFRSASGRAARLRAVALSVVAQAALAEEIGNRGGTPAITQASSVAASGAMPAERGNAAGSAAARLLMTGGRGFAVGPCRA